MFDQITSKSAPRVMDGKHGVYLVPVDSGKTVIVVYKGSYLVESSVYDSKQQAIEALKKVWAKYPALSVTVPF